jgi:hypothetical protein
MDTIVQTSPSYLTNPAHNARIRTALGLLRDALEGAVDLRKDVWEFAVSLRELREGGVTTTDLRWLVGMGYVRHALEGTKVNEIGRSFRPARNAAFGGRVCFVLTPEGVRFAEDRTRLAANGFLPARNDRTNLSPSSSRPRWDAMLRCLSYEGQVVKHFRHPALNQETILMALEEENWPPRIDDPLPPSGTLEPRMRLHDAIKALNRHQKHSLLSFRGDGTGCGVVWSVRERS